MDVARPTMADAFKSEPSQWGLRGDPYVWDRMRELLEGVGVPVDRVEQRRLLRAAFRTVVGVDVEHEAEEDRVHIAELDHGGQSGGWVDLVTWRERLMPILEARLSPP